MIDENDGISCGISVAWRLASGVWRLGGLKSIYGRSAYKSIVRRLRFENARFSVQSKPTNGWKFVQCLGHNIRTK